MAQARDARGRFTSGGGGQSVGGVEVVASLDTTQVEAGVARLKGALTSVDAHTRQLDARMSSGSGSMKGFGNTVLFASNALQDFSAAGMRGVTNNIPQLVMAMGGGAGLAGGAMLAGVAIEALGKHWTSITAAFASGGPETAAQEMGRLADQTSRTADEQARLNELKREEKQIEQQKAGRPAGVAAEGKQAGEAIRESPYDVLVRDVRGVLMRQSEKNIEPEVERRLQAERARRANPLSMRHGIPVSTDEVEQIRGDVTDQLRKSIQAMAEELVRGAEFGSGREERDLLAMAAANPGLEGLKRFAQRAAPNPLGPQFEGREAEAEDNRRIAAEQARLEARGERQRRLIEQEMEAKDRAAAAERLEAWSTGAAVEADLAEMDMEVGPAAHATKEGRKAAEQAQRDMEDRLDLAERGTDLNYRLRQLMDPHRVGQSMGLDQYEASFKSQTGESPEAKRLHDIHEVLKEIRKNNQNIKMIGVKRR